MSTQLLEEYVDLKRQIRSLEEQVDVMKPRVIDQVKKQGGEVKVRGTRLVSQIRYSYEFSEVVSELASVLRDQKKRERLEGSAKLKSETEYVVAHFQLSKMTPGKTGSYVTKARKKHPSYVTKARKKHPRAYKPWSEEEKRTLREEFQDGATVRELSELLQRQPGAIRSQLVKMGL